MMGPGRDSIASILMFFMGRNCSWCLGVLLEPGRTGEGRRRRPELVLAVDISGSIDKLEARLQREGYVNAILHPDEGGSGAAPRCRHPWNGGSPAETGDWHLTRTRRRPRFAKKLAEVPIFTSAWTSISGAIIRAAAL